MPGTLDTALAITDRFYIAARALEFHAFLEFAGLMREFIRISRDPAGGCREYHAQYIGEKFGCIFGRMLAHPPQFQAFLRGWHGTTPPVTPVHTPQISR